MKNKYLYFSTVVFLILAGFLLWKFWPTGKISLKKATFSQLPGWKNTTAQQSLQTFQVSCKVFLNQDPEKEVGSKFIHLKAKDWQPACKAALQVDANSNQSVMKFFETWFTPTAFYYHRAVRGLFTGYYMPLLQGSDTKTDEYHVPIYSLPSNLITIDLGLFDPRLKYHSKLVGRIEKNRLIPYYTRKEINHGVIDQYTSVLAWIKSEVDRQFLEIEGSGVVQLTNGKRIFLGYAGQNGAPYTSIARVLIDQGVLTRDNASMQRIRTYFNEHPQQVNKVLNQNKSFVFFNLLPQELALGSQGVGLTPGYSLAVDQRWIPLGTPLWLNTTRPDGALKTQEIPFQRLMIAQDTGGAIRGPVRGDVYWGTGEDATYIAGHMKNPGYYWLLLPKQVVERLQIQ